MNHTVSALINLTTHAAAAVTIQQQPAVALPATVVVVATIAADVLNTTASESPSPPGIVDTYTTYLYTQTKETLEHLLIAVLVYVIVCLGVYKWLHHHHRRRAAAAVADHPPSPSHAHNALADVAADLVQTPAVRFPRVRRVLLVTAHPDDECMFFGPTLLALSRRRHCQVYVLCLSSGNYDQLGGVRRDELWRACEVLRVRPANVTLVQATQLADDPAVVWSADVVGRQIQRHVDALGIDAVCTFDRDGVSQHPNHRAIFYATASLFLAGLLPARCRVLTLDSTNVLRKYVFVLDLLVTLLLSAHWVVASWADVRCVRRAMEEHRSQMVWFRRLYVLCSRYMVINSWREMSVSDVELEMQIEDT